jgi:plastocyanin
MNFTNMQTRAKRNKKEREVAAAAASALTLTLTLTLTLVILMLLLLSSVSGASGVRHQIYSEANASDEGIHSFFVDVLGDAGTCMAKFTNESVDADKFASSLESELKVTEEESRLYATKGIESNVSRVLTPFSALSGGVKKITVYQTVFLTNITILKNESDYFAYVRAKNALGNIRTGADEINSSLDGIGPIELRNETSTLVFNVSESRDKLKDVYSVIDSYNEILKKYEFKGLLVDVSNDHPFLYEEITIYIYEGNTSSLSLAIDNTTYKLKNQTYQTKKHTFERLGEHLIYAEGITSEGEYITSNIVKVYVDKIPTFIYLPLKYSALLNKRVEVTGLLIDYYTEPLCGVNVTVTAGGEKSELKTDKNGCFVFNGTKSFEGCLNVSAFYPGNKTHSKSGNTIISIFFRSPVSLYIKSDKPDLNVNETVNFTGSIRGIGINQNHTVLLNISVNSTNMKTITVKNDFNFSLFFSRPGAYEVQAIFPGDVLFTPAESNVIRINVSEERVIFTKVLFGLLIALIVIGSIGVVMHARSVKKRREGDVAESVKINAAMEQKEKEAEGGEEIRESTLESKGVEDAYKLLFNTIIAKYKIKKSFTPRELTEKLKGEAFAEKLEKVTELYEKRVFGNVELSDEEGETYFRWIKDILGAC